MAFSLNHKNAVNCFWKNFTEFNITVLFCFWLGPLSIATPGEVKGYWEAHQRFGKLPWKHLISPTVEVCRNGFEMTKHMEDSIKINPIIIHDESLR